jgi:hypothetical protein
MNIGVAQAGEKLSWAMLFLWRFFSPISTCLAYKPHSALKIFEKTFIFPMLILRCLPELAKIFSKKVFEKFGG